MNGFKKTGAYRIYEKKILVVVVLFALFFTFLATKSWLVIPVLFFLFLVTMMVIKFSRRPKFALNAMFITSLVVPGLARFISNTIPFGLTIDAFLLLIWIIILLRSHEGLDWSLSNNLLTWSIVAWTIYNILELANPEALSVMAWFYAVRALALYPVLLIPLIFYLYNQKKDYYVFINIWFISGILSGLYGLKQFLFGVNKWEQAWLDAGAGLQHVLWGKLRVFSFLSDAAVFGAFQAHIGTTALIFAVGEPQLKKRMYYLITSIVCFTGMVISGTRGAIAVPIAGLFVFLLLSKNYKILSIGFIAGSIVLYTLAFTMKLNRFAPVARMRSAFNSKDESLMVRKENRAILNDYMKDKPFGGGVGSAGFWGERFTPGTFLASFQTDGAYVRIYAEEGIVGLYLYLFLYGLIFFKMVWIVWHTKDPVLSKQMAGLVCGLIGVMAANWGNSFSGQIPESLIFYWSMVFVFLSPKWDKGEEYPVFGEVKMRNDKSLPESKIK